MVKDLQGTSIWNIPNALTALRLVLAIVLFVLIPLQWFLGAFVVFVIAASTDWADGYLARRFGQNTQVGRIFDPFVDKIMICGVFIFLASEKDSGITAWMAVVVFAREMLVTALRAFIEQHGGDFSAKMFGKLKMVFQCIAVAASLLVLSHTTVSPPRWMTGTLVVFVWLALLSTIYSGVKYVIAAVRFVGRSTG